MGDDFNLKRLLLGIEITLFAIALGFASSDGSLPLFVAFIGLAIFATGLVAAPKDPLATKDVPAS